MVQPLSSHELSAGWQFKPTHDQSAGAWLSVAKVPTNVHLDLLAHEKIPDPFLGFNELQAEWVGEKAWTYRVSLPVVNLAAGQRAVLAFDGLDTFATVKLNGATILESDNMFIPARLDVTAKLKRSADAQSTSSENILEIDFDSALLRARAIQKEHPEHKWVCFNGEPARLGVRKAQYHWGWDWGPVLMTCGPWRPVRLEVYEARLVDLSVDYTIEAGWHAVRGTITAQTEGFIEGQEVAFRVARHGGAEVCRARATTDAKGRATVEFQVKDAQLWYPHGYGAQALYDFDAKLEADGLVVDTQTKRVGLRQVDLVQEPDSHGKTFYFRINGIDVYCGGSDWIPADSFTPRVSDERYRQWLQMMVDGNQVMIRIWGGGIWEEQIFYDLCDELGVMVWQDFMFGCGNYPCWPEMLDSIREEAHVNVRRLRHHACVVIYAGNNEDYQVQEQSGLTYNYEDKNPDNWLKTNFPARYIYEKILPEAVAAESPSVPYHPGSPWGDGKISSDPTVGDMHQWNVWHGTQEKYQIFDTLGGRFNSEFGMEAFPHLATIEHFCTDKTQLYPQSHMIDFHNKADGHERRIATYLVENFRTVTDLPGFIHLTQLNQSEALMFGYRGWRKRWGTPNRFCGGALVWQLNDCWPVTSWSIVDYYLRKKPAYYAMARTLAPVAVGVQRAHHDWSVVHARPAPRSTWELWVASFRLEPFTADVELRFVSIATGKDIAEKVLKRDVTIKPNGTTEILTGEINNRDSEPHVLAARVIVDGKVLARDTDWPQPLKYLSFADRGLKVRSQGDALTIACDKPVKGLVFEEREGILVSDSALDVVPGDEQVVTVRNLKNGEEPLGWRFLGQGEPGN